MDVDNPVTHGIDDVLADDMRVSKGHDKIYAVQRRNCPIALDVSIPCRIQDRGYQFRIGRENETPHAYLSHVSLRRTVTASSSAVLTSDIHS